MLVKLADFGLSVALACDSKGNETLADSPSAVRVDNQSMSSQDTWHLTGGTGSYVYMAPEVYMRKPYNEKADVFSFAIIMYELFHREVLSTALSAQYAKDVEDAEWWAKKVAFGTRRPLSQKLPQQLQEMISECWASRADDRPAMPEVLQQLKALKESGVFGTQQQAGRQVAWIAQAATTEEEAKTVKCCIMM